MDVVKAPHERLRNLPANPPCPVESQQNILDSDVKYSFQANAQHQEHVEHGVKGDHENHLPATIKLRILVPNEISEKRHLYGHDAHTIFIEKFQSVFETSVVRFEVSVVHQHS